jgi:hypothetical protein
MDSEGWIKHDGSGCPVDGSLMVDVRWDGDAESYYDVTKTFSEAKYVAFWSRVTEYRLAEPVTLNVADLKLPEPEIANITGVCIGGKFYTPEDDALSGLYRKIADLEADLDLHKSTLRQVGQALEVEDGCHVVEVALVVKKERDQLREDVKNVTFLKNIWLDVAKDYANAIEGYRDAARCAGTVVQSGDDRRNHAGLLVVAPVTHMLGQGNAEEGESGPMRPLFSWGNPV